MHVATSEQIVAEKAFLEKFFKKHADPRAWRQRGLAAVRLLVDAAHELYGRLQEAERSLTQP